MKTVILSTLGILLLSGSLAHAALSCPKSYQVGFTCSNNKTVIPDYEKVPQVANDKFLFCVGPQTPKYVLVSEQPLDARLNKKLDGADDGMFGRNGFGVFGDKAEKAAVVFLPVTGTTWRVLISDAQANGGPDSASEYNCVK
jgi:hypothetical protein